MPEDPTKWKTYKVKLQCRITDKLVTVTFWHYPEVNEFDAECNCGADYCLHICAASTHTVSVIQRELLSSNKDGYGRAMRPPETKG